MSAHAPTRTIHATNPGAGGDKQQRPEEENDCFRHMWQESTRRMTQRGEKNGKAGSVTGGPDSHTDAQMGKMTDRLKGRQAGWLIFCYASHCRRTPI